jgi:hypothetical protein
LLCTSGCLSAHPSVSRFSCPVCIFWTGYRKLKLLGRNVNHNETMCREQFWPSLGQGHTQSFCFNIRNFVRSVSFEPIERIKTFWQEYYLYWGGVQNISFDFLQSILAPPQAFIDLYRLI